MVVQHQGRSANFDPTTLAFGLSPDYNDFIHGIDFTQISSVKQFHPSRQLERLVLNIANLCNLNCSYCYAQGGDYGGPLEKMQSDTGMMALTKFFHEYDEISTIQFFGGEPFLNWKEMRRLCQHAFDMADSLGKSRPVLMVSTNGTILNDDIIALINAFDLKVTVSIDGPPAITNLLRPMRNGKVTSDVLVTNLRRMIDETGQPSQIEGTYTDTHVAMDHSVKDVVDYISNEFCVPLLHMPCNVLPGDKAGIKENGHQFIIDAYAAAVADAIDTLVNKPFGQRTILNGALEIVEELVKPGINERAVICPAGSGTMAVDSNGDIYPCFMFYRKKEFLLGTVKDEATVQNDADLNFINKLRRNNSSQKFYQSWARRFFMGCAGGNYFKNEDHGTVTDFEVELVEAMVSAAIVELSILKETAPDKLESLPALIGLFKMYVNTPQLG
jgi:uncharacterized protein